VVGVSSSQPYESAVERAIREAQERGQFDNLPHSGKPLPGLDGPDDELWWVRSYVRREGLSGEDFLPESLLLRRQLERLDDTVAQLRTEQAVRDHVEDLNRQIRRARLVASGPSVVHRQAVADDVVARWRARRPRPTTTRTPPEQTPPEQAAPARRRPWWRRLGRLVTNDRASP
jgi:DnaJ-like protein